MTTMNNENDPIFNRGVALGEAFCNREVETKQLINNINHITHTLLISPRRYGKTSLALNTITKTKLPYAHLDLFMKYSKQDILSEFYDGIGYLISKIIKPSEKGMKIVENFFKQVKISLVLGGVGLEFSFTPIATKENQNLKKLLINTDEFLASHNKKCVIFIDEIQTITESDYCDEIEAALRFVAQKTKHITFIFSGSSRRLLDKIFDDKSRPFYKLCHKMNIQRIASQHYIPFLNKFAIKKWKNKLTNDTLSEIFNYTNCHPYYVNILCEKLFALEILPNEDVVQKYWSHVCNEEQGSIAKDLEFITPKQKQLLTEIAKHEQLFAPSAKAFMQQVNFSPKGALDAIQILLKHDIIEKTETGEIRIIDPVLEYLAKDSSRNLLAGT